MLRLGALDSGGEGHPPLPVSQALITRALVDLASERLSGGTASYAIEQFCTALLGDAPRAAQGCIDRLIDCGISVDSLYDAYIPRAAARLGELWVDDAIGFADVTLGCARLTEVFRRLSPAFLKNRPAHLHGTDQPRHALFALVPGETHALGVVMAADYFQRAGWSVRVELRADDAALERIARDRPFDAIGLSAGSRRMIPDVARTIARLREASPPSTRFLLGGPVVALEDGVARKVGADMAVSAASDAIDAFDAIDAMEMTA